MATASYKTVVKVPGTSTMFADEDMTLVSATTYQIEDATKQVWDRAVKPTFYDDGTEIPESSILRVNYLFGKVTLASPPSGTVTVDGNYLPMVEATGVKEHSFSLGGDILDQTTYENNEGYRRRLSGLKDVSATLTGFDIPWFWDTADCGKNTAEAIDVSTDPAVFDMEASHGLTDGAYIKIDNEILGPIAVNEDEITAPRGAFGTNLAAHSSGADVFVVNITYATRNAVLVECRPGGGADIWRGWFTVESTEDSGAVADVESDTINLVLARDSRAAFGISWL
jgi:hypothetical protein